MTGLTARPALEVIATSVADAAIPVVQSVDGGVELVVAPEGLEHEASRGGLEGGGRRAVGVLVEANDRGRPRTLRADCDRAGRR